MTTRSLTRLLLTLTIAGLAAGSATAQQKDRKDERPSQQAVRKRLDAKRRQAVRKSRRRPPDAQEG